LEQQFAVHVAFADLDPIQLHTSQLNGAEWAVRYGFDEHVADAGGPWNLKREWINTVPALMGKIS
jgi:hypothetical protein